MTRAKPLSLAAVGIALAATLLASLSSPAPAAAPAPPSAPAKLTWGDQGDGTFKNPILKADFSDPDVIRVGNDFYLVASDFAYVGIQVLHSTDLVNWKIIGQIFDKLTMAPKYDQMQGYGHGTWVPTMRYHNGEFYLYVCTPQDGLYMWHAKNPAGPWSETITVWAQPRLEDPCPFWDDDGTGYLIRGQVGAGPLFVHKLSPDGTKLLDEGKEVYRGNVSEGPKLFKRNGYYYICLPEGGVERGGQTMLRSKDIYGPYERKVVLVDGSPHQGSIVDLESGESWFIGFKSTGWLGRVAHLEPVKWGEDNWPTFGNDGKHVEQAPKPNLGPASKLTLINGQYSNLNTGSLSLIRVPPIIGLPDVNDEFASDKLAPIWQWNHNPINENWSLTEARGFLRLKAAPATGLAQARNTLTQKIWDEYGIVDVKLSTAKMADGQNAGLAFESGNQFGYVGVRQENGKRTVGTAAGTQPPGRGAPPAPVASAAAPFAGPEVADVIHLRGIYEQGNGATGRGTSFYSFDGKKFEAVPGTTTLFFSTASWKGARIALFSYGLNPGAADFDAFHYNFFSSRDALNVAQEK